MKPSLMHALIIHIALPYVNSFTAFFLHFFRPELAEYALFAIQAKKPPESARTPAPPPHRL